MGFFEVLFWLLVLCVLIRNDYMEGQRWWQTNLWWKLWRD
jgi:hypothetical protein